MPNIDSYPQSKPGLGRGRGGGCAVLAAGRYSAAASIPSGREKQDTTGRGPPTFGLDALAVVRKAVEQY